MARTSPTRQAKFVDMALGQGRQYDPIRPTAAPYFDLYGPGSIDYIELRDPRQVGPLITPRDLIPSGTEKPPTRRQMEQNFRDNVPTKRDPNSFPEPKRKKKRALASNETGVMNDAGDNEMEVRSKDAKGKSQPVDKRATPPSGSAGSAPGSATPVVQGTKGDFGDPMSFLGQLLASMLSGGIPDPSMGGGTTTVPKGGSPFTAQPTAPMMANPFMEMVADPSIIGQGGWGAETVSNPPVPPRNPQFQQGAPTMKPGMPTPNPLFHGNPDTSYGARGEIGGSNDMRSIGAILEDIFGLSTPGLIPPTPQRNPMFTGGV